MAGEIKVKVVADTKELDKELKKPRTFSGLLGFNGIGGKKKSDKGSEKSNDILGNIFKKLGVLAIVASLFSGLIRLMKPFVDLFSALSFLVWFPLWKALKPALVGLSKSVGNVAKEGGGITGLVRGGKRTVEEGLEGESIFKRIGVALIAGIVGMLAIAAIIIVGAITSPFIAAFGLIIAAIAAITTVLILAWDPLVALFNVIVKAWKDFFKDMGTAWKITINFFKKMGNKISEVWGNFITNIKSGFSIAVQFFKDLPSKILDAMQSGFDIFVNGIKNIINGITSALNSVLGFTGINIPQLANGGIVTKPTLALIGERGPEAVVPLSKGGSSFGGGGNTIHNTFQLGPINNNMDVRVIAEKIAEINKDELAMSTASQRF